VTSRTPDHVQWDLPGRPGPATINWIGDRLVDLGGGGASVGLDGSTTRPGVHWSFPFDRAVSLDDGSFQVLYVKDGTKGVVTAGYAQRQVREINRSFYCAAAYEYPVEIGVIPEHGSVLFHCPDNYNQLVIEKIESGERLAAPTDCVDFFHSRLRLSPNGRFLLSAGWVWHPVGIIHVYDLEIGMKNPAHLGGEGILPERGFADAYVEAACWLSEDLIAVATAHDEESLGWDDVGLKPGELGVWSLSEAAWVARWPLRMHVGSLHRIGRDLLSSWDHPRTISTDSGLVTEAWPELQTGRQVGCIFGSDREAQVACDGDNRRFAVLKDKQVAMVQL